MGETMSTCGSDCCRKDNIDLEANYPSVDQLAILRGAPTEEIVSKKPKNSSIGKSTNLTSFLKKRFSAN